MITKTDLMLLAKRAALGGIDDLINNVKREFKDKLSSIVKK